MEEVDILRVDVELEVRELQLREVVLRLMDMYIPLLRETKWGKGL